MVHIAPEHTFMGTCPDHGLYTKFVPLCCYKELEKERDKLREELNALKNSGSTPIIDPFDSGDL